VSIPHHWDTEVIRFWFEELDPKLWFERDLEVDAMIRSRYLDWFETISVQVPKLTGAPHALATVIVLDQFPRNLFRGSPRAFATDDLALAVAEQAIAAGWDAQLSPAQRVFLYMPFQHAEDRAVQVRSIELFTRLGNVQTLDYAQRHKEVIDRFGRYPHRNTVLGRPSTTEEVEFLKTHPGF
jgi:uncharacterized protein (DUF924 family)